MYQCVFFYIVKVLHGEYGVVVVEFGVVGFVMLLGDLCERAKYFGFEEFFLVVLCFVECFFKCYM